MSMFNMYRPKKKKAVDPNAPPRPNLLSHEKVLKDTKLTIEQQAEMIRSLQRRVDQLESKLSNQNSAISTLTGYVANLMRRK